MCLVKSDSYVLTMHALIETFKQYRIQECIPVGCVPSAAVAVCWLREGGVSAGGMSARGMFARGGGACLPDTPSVYRMTDANENYVADGNKKVWEGNVFTPVCHSVQSGWRGDLQDDPPE